MGPLHLPPAGGLPAHAGGCAGSVRGRHGDAGGHQEEEKRSGRGQEELTSRPVGTGHAGDDEENRLRESHL